MMRELEFWQDCLWFTCGLLPVQNWKEYNFKTIKALCKKKVRRAIRDQSYSSLYLCGNTPKNCLAVLYDFMFFFFLARACSQLHFTRNKQIDNRLVKSKAFQSIFLPVISILPDVMLC